MNSAALIAAHNHPSGAAEPSESDRMLTQDLIAASRPLGLKVLDHVIAGEETTFSFADSGLLDELDGVGLAPDTAGRHTKRAKPTDGQERRSTPGNDSPTATRRGAFARVGAHPFPAGEARV